MKFTSYCLMIVLAMAAFFKAHSTQAQQIINAASHEVLIAGDAYTYSIGEMVLVDTYAATDFMLTQGFLQPAENFVISVAEAEWVESGLHVFPNPFNHWVQVQLNDGDAGSFRVEILDASGRLVYSDQLVFSGVKSSHTLHLSGLSAGCYIVKATSQTNTTNNTYISRLLKN